MWSAPSSRRGADRSDRPPLRACASRGECNAARCGPIPRCAQNTSGWGSPRRLKLLIERLHRFPQVLNVGWPAFCRRRSGSDGRLLRTRRVRARARVVHLASLRDADRRTDRSRPHCSTRPDPVKVVPPDPGWCADRRGIRGQELNALGDRALSVERVGSTDVPGLWVKPVIGVDLVVADSDHESAYIPTLRRQGQPGFQLKGVRLT